MARTQLYYVVVGTGDVFYLAEIGPLAKARKVPEPRQDANMLRQNMFPFELGYGNCWTLDNLDTSTDQRSRGLKAENNLQKVSHSTKFCSDFQFSVKTTSEIGLRQSR